MGDPAAISFPDAYGLNGPDTFLAILDRLMRRNCGRGNICHFALHLPDPLPPSRIQEALDDHAACQWITRLRMHMGWWGGIPQWKIGREGGSGFAVQEGSLDPNRLKETIDPVREAPFQVCGYGTDDAVHTLLFVWHHALMDARGAELLVQDLGQSLPGEPVYLDAKDPVSDHSQWKHALEIKERLFDINRFPFLTPCGKKRTRTAGSENSVLRFSEEETAAIEDNMNRAGAGLNKSHFYLAACANSLGRLMRERGDVLDDIVVTLPQDRRRRGALGPLIRNQVTFLFYRIPADRLGSMPDIIRDLGKQMMDLMREQFPARFMTMMELFRHLPPPFHRFMLQRPTQKNMASFFFSDTGTSLDAFTKFLGSGVEQAVHYPPNMHPPGLTFIFSRHRSRLQVTVGEDRNELTSEESQRLRELLKDALVKPHHDNQGKEST